MPFLPYFSHRTKSFSLPLLTPILNLTGYWNYPLHKEVQEKDLEGEELTLRLPSMDAVTRFVFKEIVHAEG